jgi:hypothetical protein
MECQYCKGKFKTNSSLKHHQKTARYCLNKRGIKNTNFRCSTCKKTFSSNYNLSVHIVSCGKSEVVMKLQTKLNHYVSILDQKEQIIEDLKNTIQTLQDKLENIAIKAVQRTKTVKNNNTQINNFIQNMKPISSEYLIEHAPTLTLEHIKKGASGYAEYALEGPLKDRVACVDYSRRKIKFKDKEGNVITDPEMVKLAPMFFESIKGKSSELIYSQNTPDMDSAMFEEVVKLFNINSDVKNGSTGIKSDFYHDFVKYVCSGSLVD